jgi:hypothetical protein
VIFTQIKLRILAKNDHNTCTYKKAPKLAKIARNSDQIIFSKARPVAKKSALIIGHSQMEKM